MAKEDFTKNLELEKTFNAFLMGLHSVDNYQSAAYIIQDFLLKMIEADRFTIYQTDLKTNTIISKTKIGGEFEGIKEIKLLLSTASIAGYVALSHKSIIINDVYDKNELRAIDESLCFDTSFDKVNGYKSKSMIVVPIKWMSVLLGVLQIINHKDGSFSRQDLSFAQLIAEALAQKLRYDAQATSGPYEYLLKSNKITEDQLKDAEIRARELKTDVAAILLSKQLVSSSEIAYSLERYYQVPFMTYDYSKPIDETLTQGLKLDYLIEQHWVPIERNGNEVTILIDDPTNNEKILQISRILPAESYKFCVGTVADIIKYINNKSKTSNKSQIGFEEVLKQIHELDKTLKKNLNEGNFIIVEFVNQLIIYAHERGASDIHIEAKLNNEPAIVRLRIDGLCESLCTIPIEFLPHITRRIKILATLDISNQRLPQDGKIYLNFNDNKIELRVVIVPTVNNESIVLRILSNNNVFPFEKLDFSPSNAKLIKNALENQVGIFFVTGATGSGKTTTLHSLLSHINSPTKKFFTIEDPIEITQHWIQQVQVNNKIGLTFAEALRMFLRADPDVIMVGEVRDLETAEIAVQASLTGHLVFSTLHANSAPIAITRLIDLGIEPVNFSDSLVGVLTQNLIRRLCEHCKKPKLITDEEYHLIEQHYDENFFPELRIKLESTQLFHAVGCTNCNKSGYHGRIAVHEMLPVNEELKNCLRKSGDLNEIKNIAFQCGMRTMKQDAIQKVLLGKTDIIQALGIG